MKSSVCTHRRRDDVLVGAAVAHHADRLHRQQHRERLRRLAVPARACAARRGRSRRPCGASRASPRSPRRGTRTARPGPGNGCRQTTSSGRPSSRPSRRTSSLNRSRSGSISSKPEFRRQAADVVVQLDRRRRAVGARRRSRSRPGRACPGPGSARRGCDFASCLNTSMNTWPMIFRFSCGSVTPVERRQEPLAGVDDVQVGLELVAEGVPHDLGLALAQQAVVDEDARDLRADRLHQQRRAHATNRRRRTARR